MSSGFACGFELQLNDSANKIKMKQKRAAFLRA